MSEYLVRYSFPSGRYVDLKTDGGTKLTNHFKVYEYANTKGKITVPQLLLNEETWKLYVCFEEFRKWYGKSITVNSNYRQIQFNKNCGGSINSLHLKGLAIDWKCTDSEERRKEIEHKWHVITAEHALIGGCNWYTNGFHFSIHEEYLGYKEFVHRDYRKTKSDW